MMKYVLNDKGIAFQQMLVQRFGCDDGKARGRSLSPQRRNELEKKSPGSTCTIKTKSGEPRYYRQSKGTMRKKGAERAKEQGREVVDRDKEQYVGRPLSPGGVMDVIRKQGIGGLAFVAGNDGRVHAYRRKKPLTLQDVQTKAKPQAKGVSNESIGEALASWQDKKDGKGASIYNLAKEMGIDRSDKKRMNELADTLKGMINDGSINFKGGVFTSNEDIKADKPEVAKPKANKGTGERMTPGQVAVATRDAINSLGDVINQRGFATFSELFRKARSKNPNYSREDMKRELENYSDSEEVDLYTINSILDADDPDSAIKNARGVLYYIRPRWNTSNDPKMEQLEKQHNYKAGPEGEFIEEEKVETNTGGGEINEGNFNDAMKQLESADYRGFADINELMDKMNTKDRDAVMGELERLSSQDKITLMKDQGNVFIRRLNASDQLGR